MQGDFGFSLRRGMKAFTNSNPRKDIVLAEPAVIGDDNITGLLPGDQLLKVNGDDVSSRTRDEIISLVKNSGQQLLLQVSPVQELSEITARQLAKKKQILEENGSDHKTLSRSSSLSGLIQVRRANM